MEKKISLIDFTSCPCNDRTYGGNAGRKLGIVYEGENWILKFPGSTAGFDKTEISYTTSPISEYIGSHIFSLLGFEVHETKLGIYGNKLVVACKDFLEEGDRLLEFRELKNMYTPSIDDSHTSFSGGSGDGTELETILLNIEHNRFLKEMREAKQFFWDMFCVDTLIGNSDRNNSNWGIIKKRDGHFVLAPVYDNGNCFNNKLSVEEIRKKLNNKEAMESSAFRFSLSALRVNGTRLNVFPFILQKENEDCTNAMIRIAKRIDLKKINEMLEEIPMNYGEIVVFHEEYKQFIKEILVLRKKHIFDKIIG